MFEKINYIELSGVKYPIKCDILVLEKIQDKYTELSEFENKIRGFYPKIDEDGLVERNEDGLIVGISTTPDIKALKDALIWMVEEGIEIVNEESPEEYTLPLGTQLFRMVDIPPKELGEILHEEFNRCFVRKNAGTTQSQTTENPKE